MKPGPQTISITSYDYDLPEGRIAQYPLDQRDRSKILVYRKGEISQDIFSSIADHLPGNGLLIFNETRVVHARLLFRKPGGSQVEIFCLEPGSNIKDPQLALSARGSAEWSCLVGNSKRWKAGPLLMEEETSAGKIILNAERVGRTSDGSIVRFSWTPESLPFSTILECFGKVPLPPYIQRKATGIDEDHYQTVYARNNGSVAAPTAGLHFTAPLLKELTDNGLKVIKFTLHVGAGTFKPVSSEKIGDHEMHPEQIHLELDKLRELYQSLDKPIILVGTTSVRLMESLYWHGVKLIKGLTSGPEADIRQWDPYEIDVADDISRAQSLEKVIETLEMSGSKALTGETRLMIAPGYQFRFPDIIITNFHQPKSTLLLLIAAFIGEDWKNAYRFALDNEFRFLSYGDSCVFYRS
jgi:S-adenosylmethionine:tRNA ribosyltransferase-isomerase